VNTYRNALLFVLTTCVFIGHVKASEQTPAAPMPAPSRYPQSSGPIWFDPAPMIKNVHIALKKHPTLKIPMYSIRNDNDYEICTNHGTQDASCILPKSETWGNHFKEAWGTCPLFYVPIDTSTKKVLRKDGGSYTCLLEGSPEWYDLIRLQ